jgi:hypothetical protein
VTGKGSDTIAVVESNEESGAYDLGDEASKFESVFKERHVS